MASPESPGTLSRRTLLTSAAVAAAVPYSARALAFIPGTEWPALQQNEQQIPFVNDTQPADLTNQIVWQEPFDWHTPADHLYDVAHYDKPTDLSDGHIDITGMVERPRTLSLDDLKRLPRIDYTATMECGGNGLAGRFMGAIGNMRWSGTPLESVQLKIDDGEWLATTLQPKPADATPHTWTFWSYVWTNPAAGTHTLVSRATDAKGRVQPTETDPEIALKKTYWEANQQIVRQIEI